MEVLIDSRRLVPWYQLAPEKVVSVSAAVEERPFRAAYLEWNQQGLQPRWQFYANASLARVQRGLRIDQHEPLLLKGKVRRTGLARALSKMGYCSRSQAAELIHAGRVRLNGSVQHYPERPVRIDSDRILVDGHQAGRKKKIYLMMNKPRGLVTTASDEKGRDTVYSVLAGIGESLPWVAPVGRLDKASEGLLLLTNDSEWGARVAAPETHLDKTYHVQIATIESDSVVAAMMRGVRVDCHMLTVKQCRLLRSGEKNCWLEITLDEGKNRQIRRMLAGLGVEVLRLLRVSIGPLQLGPLAKGTYRSLSAEEKSALDQAMKK